MPTTLDIDSIPNGLAVLTSEAGQCPDCKRMTCFFHSVRGKSTCLDCAEPLADRPRATSGGTVWGVVEREGS